MIGTKMIVPKNYPKYIYLRGDRYHLKFIKGLKAFGETDSGDLTIKIRAGMSKNETFRTFIHEILHVLEFSWPIKMKHKTIYKLEKAIFALLLDNFI
jgi:hypothetical protein